MFICNDRKNRFSHVTDRVVEKKSQRPRFFTFLGIWILNEKLRNGAKGESEKNRFFFFENLHFVDDFLFFYKLMKEKWEHELFAHTKYNIVWRKGNKKWKKNTWRFYSQKKVAQIVRRLLYYPDKGKIHWFACHCVVRFNAMEQFSKLKFLLTNSNAGSSKFRLE